MLFQARVRWKRFVRNTRQACWLVYVTFFYNEFSASLAKEVGLAPIYCLISLVNNYLQAILPYLVALLIGSIVCIFYLCVLPILLIYESTLYVCVNLIIGHWLLINIAFNFYAGVKVEPGYPPNFVNEMVSICKKCVAPKPPRTHHCSVCRRCILKMDHHCPWLKNCVGFYNHRYFFLFVAYVAFGCLFVAFHSWPLFMERRNSTQFSRLCAISPDDRAVLTLELPTDAERSVRNVEVENIHDGGMHLAIYSPSSVCSLLSPMTFYNLISFEFVLTVGATIALAALGSWHAYLVSTGQTSIELHVNKRERARLQKLGLVYRNPYDFGIIRNWIIFLGIDHSRNSFWCNVLLPSWHTPSGDALHFRTCFLDSVEVERRLLTDD